MKKFISILFFGLIVNCLTLNAYAGNDDVRKGIEALDIAIHVDEKLNGYAIVTNYVGYKKMRFNVNKDTQVTINDKPVHLSYAQKNNGKPGTVMYNPKTNTIMRIQW
ncbi:MAG: hypothetical protein OEY89_03245 [Gammaproteobacteria bacterium]|nr:hypothetical protein [Gammaproteobacteria bacterium]